MSPPSRIPYAPTWRISGLSSVFYAAYLLALGVLLARRASWWCGRLLAALQTSRALFVAMLLVLLGATFSGSIGARATSVPSGGGWAGC